MTPLDYDNPRDTAWLAGLALSTLAGAFDLIALFVLAVLALAMSMHP
jgi:hypothetical protein